MLLALLRCFCCPPLLGLRLWGANGGPHLDATSAESRASATVAGSTALVFSQAFLVPRALVALAAMSGLLRTMASLPAPKARLAPTALRVFASTIVNLAYPSLTGNPMRRAHSSMERDGPPGLSPTMAGVTLRIPSLGANDVASMGPVLQTSSRTLRRLLPHLQRSAARAGCSSQATCCPLQEVQIYMD